MAGRTAADANGVAKIAGTITLALGLTYLAKVGIDHYVASLKPRRRKK